MSPDHTSAVKAASDEARKRLMIFESRSLATAQTDGAPHLGPLGLNIRDEQSSIREVQRWADHTARNYHADRDAATGSPHDTLRQEFAVRRGCRCAD